MPASVVTVNFAKADPIRLHSSGVVRDRGSANDMRPMTPDGKLLTAKQIRARARRRAAKTGRTARSKSVLTQQEFEALYKPVEEWDIEELAKGRPRDVNGGWSGLKPKWVTREVHERAMEMFIETVKSDMHALAPTALDSIRWVLTSDETDERGKPLVPASAKNQASMFLLEHVVGKPKQVVQEDISVKLQGILGAVMVNPNDALAPPSQGGMPALEASDTPAYSLAHFPGQTIPLGAASDTIEGEVDDDSDLDPGE